MLWKSQMKQGRCSNREQISLWQKKKDLKKNLCYLFFKYVVLLAFNNIQVFKQI